MYIETINSPEDVKKLTIEELPIICWCGKKAHFNARVIDGKMVRDGAQIALGANDMYVPLCRRHFMSGEIKPYQTVEEK